MQYGISICDGCDRIVDKANVIPLKLRDGSLSSRDFTFAFCTKCDKTEVHQRVFKKAAQEYTEWMKNHPR